MAHLGKVLAFRQGDPPRRPVYVADGAGVAFHSLQDCFFREPFHQLNFIFVLGDGLVGLQSLVRVNAHGLHLLAEFLLADGFDHLVAVDVDAQIAFHGPLRLGFGGRQDAGDHVGVLRYGVQVGGSAAYIQHDNVADAVVEQLGAFHDGAGGRDDGPVHHVAHVLHARGPGDVVLEGILDDLAAGLHIELVDLGIYVFDIVKRHAALLVEDELHFLLIFDVAGIDNGYFQSHGPQHFRVVDGRVSFTVVHASRQKDKIRLDLLDLRQVRSAEPSCGHIMDDAPRAERRFLRRLGRHVIDEAVDGHLQTAGCGRSRQHLVVFQGVDARLFLQVFDGAREADAHVAFQDGGGRLTLGKEHRMIGVQIFKGIYNCRGGADLGYQYVYFHMAFL